MHEGGVIVAWGAAESNSSLLGALQTSQVRSPRFSRLRRSTLACACTPLTKSEEKERLLAVQLFSATILSCIPSKTETQPLLYSKRRIQKNSPLTFWPLERFTIHLTLIMRKCLHEHWSWSTLGPTRGKEHRRFPNPDSRSARFACRFFFRFFLPLRSLFSG